MSAAVELRAHVGAAVAAAKRLDASLCEAAKAHGEMKAALVAARQAASAAGVKDVEPADVLARWSHPEAVVAVLAREGVPIPVSISFAGDKYLGDLVGASCAALVKRAEGA